MTKTIIKEIGIVLLLLVAVAMLLIIVFYDYIPMNKIVPVRMQAYNIPEDIRQELAETTLGEQNIVRTYYIDSSDLDLYESTNDYNKGKANPFADYTADETTNTTTNSKTKGKTNSTNSTRNANEQNSNTSKNTNTNDNEESTAKDEVYINTPGKNY